MRGKNRTAARDLAAIIVVGGVATVLAFYFDAFEAFEAWSRAYEGWQADEVAVVLVVLGLASGVYSWRRWRELQKEVAERAKAEAALRRSEGRLVAAQEMARLGNYEFAPDVGRVWWSDELYGIHGVGRDGLDPTAFESFLALVHPEDRNRVGGYAFHFPDEGDRGAIEYRVVRPDGEVRWVRDERAVERDDGGRPVTVIGTVQDITGRRRAEEEIRASEARFRALFDGAGIGMALVDAEGRLMRTNAALRRMLGYAEEELRGASLADVTHPGDAASDAEQWEELISGRRAHYRTEKRYVRKDGQTVWGNLTVSLITTSGGNARFAAAMVEDVSGRKALEEKLEYRATHDALTGLPNRSALADRLKRSLARARRRGQGVAALFLDLDNLKFVNDSLGHKAGDRLLAAVARRLEDALRPGETVARWGGDEFVVLAEDVGEAEATDVARRIEAALRAPFKVGQRQTFVTASTGIALSDGSGQKRAEDLLRDADLAMYRAKEGGKARHEVFRPSMKARAVERLELENGLRRAISGGQLRLHYQPKTSLQTGRIAGLEALVRWEHPERGLLLPNDFIPVAEETDLIFALGQWVLEEACRQARRWHLDASPDLPLGVNLSARQFEQTDLVEMVAETLSKTGLPPSQLELEVTETALIQDAAATLSSLRKLKSLGIKLAIDDFGTGYASLAYLRLYPADYLKLDKSFIRGLGRSPEDTTIVSAMIDLAHTLGMQVVAEGVETEVQLEELRNLGCDMAQGNHLWKPLPAGAADELLKHQAAKKPPQARG